MVPTCIRWPPACNPSDSKTVPAAHGNLAQLPAPQPGNQSGNHKKKGKGKKNGNGNGKNGKGRTGGDEPKNPKCIKPDSSMTPISHPNGEPVHEKMIQGKRFQWCGKCKRWSTTYSARSHGLNKQESKAVVAPSAGLSLIEDAPIWLAKVDSSVEPVSPT